MELIAVIIILVLLASLAATFISGKKQNALYQKLQTENHELSLLLVKNEEKITHMVSERNELTLMYKQEQDRLLSELKEEREKHLHALTAMENFKAGLKAREEKIAEQKVEIENLHQKLNKDFELIAAKILDEKTQKFTDLNRSNLDVLLNPLKENIKAFEDKVEKVYKAESDERNVLKGEINRLMELNKQISQEAHNLTRALKTDTKKQGNWGEVVLDRVLEASGLVNGETYLKQSAFTDEKGSRLQPDVVVTLPDKKHIIIDSKVSLIAYERLINCETEDDRKIHLKGHLDSIKTHISGLYSKNYQNLNGINSPDFVLLFIPIESSFSIAVQHDRDLFDFAWNKRVVIVTPSTLLATLKTIASVWKQELQTRNAIDIAVKAGALYDKFAGFITDLQKIGDNLDKAKTAYSDAFGKLSSGNGNLIGKVENLKKLGAKATKQLNPDLLNEN